MERDRPNDRTEEVRRHSSEAKTRERFAVLAQTGRFTVRELCGDFGISRKTGHKYLKRYRCDGREGLADRGAAKKGAMFKGQVELARADKQPKNPDFGQSKIFDIPSF